MVKICLIDTIVKNNIGDIQLKYLKLVENALKLVFNNLKLELYYYIF